jgi:hypothetical protein
MVEVFDAADEADGEAVLARVASLRLELERLHGSVCGLLARALWS